MTWSAAQPTTTPGRGAGYRDGMRSALAGIAANRSLAEGRPVQLAEFGLDASPIAPSGAAGLSYLYSHAP